MTTLASRLEITKLAAEMRVEEDQLAFLAETDAEELRAFREHVSRALFGRHEQRLKKLTALSKKLPPAVAAKISETALGPMLSGRIASVMDPAESAKLAGHLDRGFMAKLAVAMDPARVGGIVGQLDDALIIDLGTRLLAAGELLTLARFTAVVSDEVATAVVAHASGEQLVRLALFLEDDDSLRRLAEGLSEEQRADARSAAQAAGDGSLELLRERGAVLD